MTNPYRAMCAELLAWAEHTSSHYYKQPDVLNRARALLAQPEPEGPTDEEIEEWADACSEAPLEEMDPEVHGWRRCFTAKEFSKTIRAAIARWGRPTPQPPADGEVAELCAWLRNNSSGIYRPAARAADLLERLASDNAGLEAAADSLWAENVSLLDNCHD